MAAKAVAKGLAKVHLSIAAKKSRVLASSRGFRATLQEHLGSTTGAIGVREVRNLGIGYTEGGRRSSV
eukprot:1457608-Pyramimonas_sp.AAC.1